MLTAATKRGFAALAVFILVLFGPGAVPASSATDSARTSVIGQWHVTISVSSQDPPFVQHAIFTFTSDHHLSTINAPGEEPLVGEGIWTSSGGTFSFWITHPDVLGRINANHLGALHHDRFETSAFAYVFTPDGAIAYGPVAVHTEAVRTS